MSAQATTLMFAIGLYHKQQSQKFLSFQDYEYIVRNLAAKIIGA